MFVALILKRSTLSDLPFIILSPVVSLRYIAKDETICHQIIVTFRKMGLSPMLFNLISA